MAYKVKEIFYTLQGEGTHAGRPAVFCRFSGCNLWSGREKDRLTAICPFCDTDFRGTNGVNGGVFHTADLLAQAVAEAWLPTGLGKPYVVCTGGEPALQLDDRLIHAFHQYGLEIAIETNGTLPLPEGIDWVCVSPKAGTTLQIRKGNELKLVFPQAGAMPESYESLEFDKFYLQPMDGILGAVHTKMTVEFCLKNPKWSLSLQTHKILNIP
jgi:7-carboxy-7-deazaguanine synthase